MIMHSPAQYSCALRIEVNDLKGGIAKSQALVLSSRVTTPHY